MLYPHELMKKGGSWLGAARNWLQWNTRNGDRVTWGSNDLIEPQLTVKQVEELASEVACKVYNEKEKEIELLRLIIQQQKETLLNCETALQRAYGRNP